jgi:acetyl-CoA carboxylase carboxyl transferase subunit beta
MSWLKEIVRPKVATRSKRDVKPNVFSKCPSCAEMLYERDLKKNNRVCMKCGHHLRVGVETRLNFMMDDGFKDVPLKLTHIDPLGFKDRKRYSDRLKDAGYGKRGRDAYRVVKGTIGGAPAVVCVFDFAFMAGSMGTHVGSALVKAAEKAVKEKSALIVVPASGGARMQEGILSLMQMARSTAAIQDVKEKGLPYIVMLTDPTTGGVSASFAMLGDIIAAEPGALIGFAGPRVIEQTIGETLPEGFQTAEYLLENGMVDTIVPRAEQKEWFGKTLNILMKS